MQGIFKSFTAKMIMALTLVAFAMPAFTILFYTIPAEASATFDADCGIMVIEKADLDKNHQKSKSDKIGDNCCISHHCCAAKMVFNTTVAPAVFSVGNVDLAVMSNQHVSGQLIYSLDRPPKSVV